MAWKDMFQNVVKQASNYLENNNIKEKLLEVKDKTVEKVKGIDNPEHYSAPDGFVCFQTSIDKIELNELEREQFQTFGLKEDINTITAYQRLITLLSNETIVNMIMISMKRPFLLAWTNKDRLILVQKECYKILTREEMHTFRVEGTKPGALLFILNEYHFSGNDKSRTYCFIRNYCHENTPAYSFQTYQPVIKSLNYYERLKYDQLNKENQAVDENKQLSILMEQFEFPLLSVFGTFQNISFILALSTKDKLYFIHKDACAVIMKQDVFKISLMSKGIFSAEFYLDNYYFTNSGPEDNLLKLIEYLNNPQIYEQAKTNFLKEHEIYTQFPFLNSTFYQTSSGSGIIISEDETTFLICSSLKQMKMYPKGAIEKYELIQEDRVTKEDMWTSGVGKMAQEHLVSKEEAILNYERIIIRIFLKDPIAPTLEIPIILIKMILQKEREETYTMNEERTRYLFDQLDRLKEGQQ